MRTSLRRYRVAEPDEVGEGGRKIVTVKGMEIGIFRLDCGYRAYRNVCPHAGAPVCLGDVVGTTLPSRVYEYEYGRERGVLRCPWHGWEFDLETGRHLTDDTKLKGYEVEWDEEGVYLLLR